MINTLSSINKQYINTENSCEIYDGVGNMIANLEGQIQELFGKFFVIMDAKLYCIVKENASAEYILEEYNGGSLI